MVGKNSGICHSCRGKGHLFAECPIKRQCPLCKTGFEKCFEVEKLTANKGRLFKCCSNKCVHCEWVEKAQSSGESSNASSTSITTAIKEVVEDMSRKFESQARLTEEADIQISVNVTIRMGKGRTEGIAKGKGPT